ncbi:MAG TPA: ester cyclase [Candidatus Limnocylindria bacterium]|nr:ester cyclase [Candidatus Limnocylindria bacterium]
MTLVQDKPTVATNIATIKQWVAAMAKGDLDHAPYAEDAEMSDPTGKYKGKAQIVQSFKVWNTAFPQGTAEVINQIAQGEQVASEVVYKATHTGPLVMSAVTIPPTSKPIELKVMLIQSFRDGLIQRERAYFDKAGLMQQLGVTVPPKP